MGVYAFLGIKAPQTTKRSFLIFLGVKIYFWGSFTIVTIPLFLLKSGLRIKFVPLKQSKMGVYVFWGLKKAKTPISDCLSDQLKFWDHFTIVTIPLLLLKRDLRFWFWPLKTGFLAILSKYPILWGLGYFDLFHPLLMVCPTWPPFQIVVHIQGNK